MARLSVALATGGLTALWQGEPASAKNKKRKNRKKKHRNGGGGGGVGSCAGGGSIPYAPDVEEQRLIGLINAYRGARGLAPLAAKAQLGVSAENHSATMAAQNSHYHSNLGAQLQLFGYSGYLMAGENIAWCQSTTSQVLADWQNSPSHNANLLNASFNQIGIGRALNAAGNCWYWTAQFGSC